MSISINHSSHAMSAATEQRMPVYFVTHGGGPWPWVEQWLPWHAELADSLRAMPSQMGRKPRAVLLIQKIIGEVFCGALLQMPEFSLNFALLHTWLGKHACATTISN